MQLKYQFALTSCHNLLKNKFKLQHNKELGE